MGHSGSDRQIEVAFNLQGTGLGQDAQQRVQQALRQALERELANTPQPEMMSEHTKVSCEFSKSSG